MKVLVTGGGGFLGKYIVKQLLAAGHEVCNFSRSRYPELDEWGVTSIQGDLTNPEDVVRALQGQEAVFHVASKVAMWGKWEDFIRTNVNGTKNILDGMKTHGIRYLIYTSTPSVVFDRDSIEGKDESLPYPKDSYSMYARSKAMAEKLVLEANQTGVIETVALRPHLIFGPGDQNLIPRLVDAAKRKRLAIIGDGRNRVDVIYVENAADAHIKAFEALQKNGAKVGGNAFFIGQGPVKLWDFVNQVLDLHHVPPIKKKVSFQFAFTMGAIIEKGLRLVGKYDTHPPMTRFVALQLSKSHYFSHQKAEELLGWKPKVNVDEGLSRLTVPQ
jgi:nucleoside-diphosphate-sugar epimerase